MKKVNYRSWVITEQTPTIIKLEARKKPSAVGVLSIMLGSLMLLLFFLTVVSSKDQSIYSALLGGIMFIYIGVQLRKTNGGIILLNFPKQSILLERHSRKGKSLLKEIRADNVEQVWVKKGLMGWKIWIIHDQGGPVDITPPDNYNIKKMTETAKLIAGFAGVEAKVVI